MQIKDIVAGKRYINKSGEEKVHWVNVGKLFIKDDGKMTVKFNEYINPSAFRNDKGEIWFNVFDEKKDEKPQEVNQVAQDGKAIAEYYRKLAEKKAAEAKAAAEPSDEEWFKEHQNVIDTLVD